LPTGWSAQGTKPGGGEDFSNLRLWPSGQTRLQETGLTRGPDSKIAETSPPPGFDPWTDQPVDSRYSD